LNDCLVTGGCGFIGSHLIDALLQRGDRVRVLDNLSTGRSENLSGTQQEVELIEADLRDAEAVDRAVQGTDLIFHQAALASVPRSVKDPLSTHAVCVTGTLNVLEAARRHDVRRVVYAASSSAYGASSAVVKKESDLPAPISPYGAAKLCGELYCAAYTQVYGLETVRLRYFNVFGPRQDPNSPYSAVIPLFVTAMLDGRQPVIYGDGRQSRDFTYVANVVQANLRAAEAPGAAGNVYNVAMGGSTTLLALVDQLNALLGTSIEPAHAAPRPGDVRESRADISWAVRDLGYEPTIGFNEGLERSIEYYRSLPRV
jgi:UDP-glucose 4-epimerase